MTSKNFVLMTNLADNWLHSYINDLQNLISMHYNSQSTCPYLSPPLHYCFQAQSIDKFSVSHGILIMVMMSLLEYYSFNHSNTFSIGKCQEVYREAPVLLRQHHGTLLHLAKSLNHESGVKL